MWWLVVMMVFLTQVPPPLATPEPVVRSPTALAERIVTIGNQRRRVSLFDSRVAVVSVQEGDEQVFFRLMTLPEDQYVGFVRALETNSAGLEELVTESGLEPADLRVELFLNLGTGPRYLNCSAIGTLNVIPTPLLAALDDLENQVSAIGPHHEEVVRWHPKRGDLVELMTGQQARVRQVVEDDSGKAKVVILERVDSPMVDVLGIDEIPQRVMRILAEVP